MDAQHVDHYENVWEEAVQRLVERLPADAEIYGGSYSGRIGPHSMDDCPFRDGDVPMRRRAVQGLLV